jgi:hypothetical protein
MTRATQDHGRRQMLKAGGYSIITTPGAKPIEHDTFTCAHCGFVTFTKSGFGCMEVAVIQFDHAVTMRQVSRCRRCFEYICPKCEGRDCTPRLASIEAEEKKARV